ncbi:MAG: hypothetical protein IT484_10700 [Gammaproteobacteria bacterium]|nr:hypothetical protein [Gammaproteobacteria bacterium]
MKKLAPLLLKGASRDTLEDAGIELMQASGGCGKAPQPCWRRGGAPAGLHP